MIGVTPHSQYRSAFRYANGVMDELRAKCGALTTELEWMLFEMTRTFQPSKEEIFLSSMRSVFTDFFQAPSVNIGLYSISILIERKS